MSNSTSSASSVGERERFEHWYATHAFDYSRDPIGSRDCSLQWEAWQAAITQHEPTVPRQDAVNVLARVLALHEGHTTEGALEEAAALLDVRTSKRLAIQQAKAQGGAS